MGRPPCDSYICPAASCLLQHISVSNCIPWGVHFDEKQRTRHIADGIPLIGRSFGPKPKALFSLDTRGSDLKRSSEIRRELVPLSAPPTTLQPPRSL